jgi:hypothetical protein
MAVVDIQPSNLGPAPETVNVTSAPPNVEQTSDAPVSNDLVPLPDAASGGGLSLSPSPGTPGSITPGNPQPTRPQKESVVQGIRRGAGGERYVVDAQGNVTNARTTASSGKGEFGSVLGGIVMGALAGLTASRPGEIPSAELGGGAGAGAAAAIQAGQQRDTRNRGVAQQNFANQQQVQKMTREQAESAAVINHLAAQTASEVQATKFADEEHPLHIAGLKAGLDESSQRIQKNAQDLMKGTLEISENLGEMGITPQAIVTNHNDARGHIPSIVQGKTLPIYNGQTGEDGGVGMYDVQQLKNTPVLKPVTYKTYPTSDTNGNAVEQINTLPAGTTAFDYYRAAAAGHGQLLSIQSQQKVKMAVEAHKADIKEKNASAFRNNAEGKKAEAETVDMKASAQAQGEDLVESNMDPSQIQKRRNTYNPILNAAREYSMKKYGVPFDLAKAQEDYKFASDPRTQNRLKYMNSLTGDERTGTAGNLDLLIQYSDKVNRTDFPALNNVAAWAKLESGNTDIIKLHNAAIDAADQFANIMNGGGSGSATSDAKIKQGMDMFSQKFSKDQMVASASSVKDMLSNRKREFIGDNRYLRKQYLPANKQSQQQGASAPQSNLQNPFRVSQ